MEVQSAGPALRRKLSGIALSLLVVVPQSAAAAPARWVVVTRPMLACWNLLDDSRSNEASLRRMQSQIRTWRPGRRLAGDCAELKIGEKLILAPSQPAQGVKFMAWCSPGCSPYQWPTFGPPVAIVGAYFEDTRPPKGLEAW